MKPSSKGMTSVDPPWCDCYSAFSFKLLMHIKPPGFIILEISCKASSGTVVRVGGTNRITIASLLRGTAV